MSSFKITECSPEDKKLIADNLRKYNLEQVAATLTEIWAPLDYVVRNDRDEVIAGILSGLGCWCGLEISTLWVDESYRKSGLGTKLLLQTELKAKAKGAVISLLDTFDFQAKDFYLKNGYTIFGEVNNFPTGHTRYYLQKRL